MTRAGTPDGCEWPSCRCPSGECRVHDREARELEALERRQRAVVDHAQAVDGVAQRAAAYRAFPLDALVAANGHAEAALHAAVARDLGVPDDPRDATPDDLRRVNEAHAESALILDAIDAALDDASPDWQTTSSRLDALNPHHYHRLHACQSYRAAAARRRPADRKDPAR